MPRGGNNRKPRNSKIIRGTFRKDRNPGNEPRPDAVMSVPAPPADMNDWARAKWRELAPELKACGLLTKLDLTSLEMLCREYGIYREAYQAVYFKAPRGRAKPQPRTLRQYLRGKNSQTTPELAAMRASLQAYRSLMSEFGLTPASRNRIDVPAPKGESDPMEEMISGGT